MSRRRKNALEPLSAYNPHRPRTLKLKDVPPAATQPPGYDWKNEYDRIFDQIASLTDRATMFRQSGQHDEAIALVRQARKLADDQSAILQRNKPKRTQ